MSFTSFVRSVDIPTSSCFASGVRMPSKLKQYRSLLLLTGLQQEVSLMLTELRKVHKTPYIYFHCAPRGYIAWYTEFHVAIQRFQHYPSSRPRNRLHT